MIISVSGFNCTGSSAVIDLLKEYDDLVVVEPEIMFVHAPDGITDLDNAINSSGNYLSGDVAISRFKRLSKHIYLPKKIKKAFLKCVDSYIDSITLATWKGYSSYDTCRESGIRYLISRIKIFFNNVLFHCFKLHPKICYRNMRLSFKDDGFIKKTRTFLTEFEHLFSQTAKNVVFNQFFSSYCPIESMKYSEDAKLIVVTRDPRDVYITERLHKDTICFPTETVNKYIHYYKSCCNMNSLIPLNNILYIRFEDLIYKYDETVTRIESFLGIKKQKMVNAFFDPNV